ncbi:bifunctional (p)ppGpp synthetase/guanosine-3',5'-bis(diphosphate) 3'-pyrophosphohydrolase [Flavobacteriales bacterium]|jgi:GTP pyrophosphokinase|nr:bifunctional (p)ppGpp synthetase/guanosine-3',5'-bis(diphosphate) 3'-pyrophosphohydrolase [Flavobacteriales bacterium]MDC0908762.1 bifunctional (p)ppGpp synthetase/guanosine-3',5'-bis(diphosphate) 3'-pyrophosphohydrolase [Flavobacteriales bacterium]MDC1069313.1 bifunctional (p)ppGpp synthetase/guanosine-3',5'-bis(diphosphate) 3'-pyrophosphohydrolase [Flavobacteriales bacterium]
MKPINHEKEKNEILNKYRSLLRSCADKTDKSDKKIIRNAFDLAVNAHKDMRRKSGEPYIYHPIAVAHIAAKEIGLGTTSIICALLHDVVEDTDYTLDDIEKKFGKKVAQIIDGLTKIQDVFDKNVSLQAENFKKMLLTLSDDVRVILIKLADRLHNMRTLDSMPVHNKLKIASETLFLYAPLAHRLGLYSIKTELEDLGLKYTKPEIYKAIAQELNETKEDRKKYITKFIKPIKAKLKETDLKYLMRGRPKSIFSIRNKMIKTGVNFDKVFDKFAIRIIIDSSIENEKSDCWKIYSIVTDCYKPNPDRLRDWISTPKANGYESLHTTVMGDNGKWVEVQIRSKRMDEIAEKGYAAHWKYKQEGSKDSSLDVWIEKIRELLTNPENNAVDFIDDFKLNLYSGEIYVFTPKGDLKTLPRGGTALDFAFEIHTDIGLKCMGIKVNGKLVSLSHNLQSGDQVEVITSQKQRPREDWLRFVATSRAKSKIKSALKEDKREIATIGKEIAERKLKLLKISLTTQTENELIRYFDANTTLNLYFQFGTGSISNSAIKEFVRLKKGGWYQSIKNRIYGQPSFKKEDKKSSKIIVFNEDDEILDYKMAACCNPIPGDLIFGFLTVMDGIKVHRSDCPNSIQLRSNYAYRILQAKWISEQEIDFIASISIKGIDSLGLMNKVTQIISNQMNVNIKSINIKTDDGIFDGVITLKVHNVEFLNDLTIKLKSLEEISSITRTYKHQ